MMKILIVRTCPWHGNPEKMKEERTYNTQEIGLAKAFIEKGYSADVLYHADRDVKIIVVDGKISVNWYFRRGLELLNMVLFYKYKDIAINYDVVITCEYDQIQSYLFARKFPTKTIIYQGPYYSDFNSRFNKKMKVVDVLLGRQYRKLQPYILTKSKKAERYLRQRGMGKISTVGVGLDIESLDFNRPKEQNSLWRELDESIEKGNQHILYIGRLEKRRNIEFLINVFRGCCQRKKNLYLVIIGDGDESYVQFCRKKIIEYELSNKIIYRRCMNQHELGAVYRKCDLFLLPTYYEIFGMVLLEAMYYGVPVITSNNGGSDMLIQNGENGFVLDNWDCSQWVDLSLSILSDFELQVKIGRNASRFIHNNYLWSSLVERFIEVCQMLAVEQEDEQKNARN